MTKVIHYTFFIFLSFIFFLSSCYRAPWSKQLKGLKAYPKQEFWYQWFGENPKAPKPQPGEEVRIDYTLQKGDTILDHSYSNIYPILVHIPEANYDNFFTKALKLMGQGDSLKVLIPADDVPDLLGEYYFRFQEDELVTVTYKMHEIKSKDNQQKQIIAEQLYLDSIRTAIPQLIETFKAGQLKTAQTTESGLSYCLFDEGTAPKAAYNDAISMHYICFTETGQIIDDSYTNMVPLSFTVGSQSLIEGWSEGATLLGLGGKAVLFIPPNLAYGTQGKGDIIPPNSSLIFYIELIDLQK